MRRLFVCNPDGDHPAWHASETGTSDALDSLSDRFNEAGVAVFITDDRWFDGCDCRTCRNLSDLASHRLAVHEGRTRVADYLIGRLLGGVR